MLTQTKDAPARLVFQTQAGAGGRSPSIVLAIVIALSVAATDWGAVAEPDPATRPTTLARSCSTSFVLPFEIVSVLLLAAVIGGVFLAKREPGGPS